MSPPFQQTHHCPLCHAVSSERIHTSVIAHPREFFHCGTCRLIFVPAQFFLAADQEKARYAEHNNDPLDQRYRNFLTQAFQPLAKRLPAQGKGLDYGSGPGPTLQLMFQEAGFEMEGFDPFFANRPELLVRKYDFITCTEAAEHFHRPRVEFTKLDGLLNPLGHLTILTGIWWEEMIFADWYYQRDPTHVIFFHQNTFRWIANHFGWKLFFEGRNVVTFQKS